MPSKPPLAERLRRWRARRRDRAIARGVRRREAEAARNEYEARTPHRPPPDGGYSQGGGF